MENGNNLKRRRTLKGFAKRIASAKRRSPPGAPPEELLPPLQLSSTTKIDLLSYSTEAIFEEKIEDSSSLRNKILAERISWLNVDGLGDLDAIKKIGEIFKLHPLAIEDIINVHQRPKVDIYEDFTLIVLRMPLLDQEHFATEQLSLVLKDNLIISFQEIVGGDCFNPLRERIRKGKNKIWSKGSDYLCYSLIDTVIDHYFPMLDRLSDNLEEIERNIIADTDNSVIRSLHSVKQELLMVRRAIWPMREAVNILLRELGSDVSEGTKLYLRDCYDHTVQLVEIVETYRELASDLMDIHLSMQSNRMNEIMKVLTVISTIFIPLTFIVGVYGMNFDTSASPWNMPELKWAYGYPLCISMMLMITGGLLVFFRRRGWI
jgi:magnesium transporter